MTWGLPTGEKYHRWTFPQIQQVTLDYFQIDTKIANPNRWQGHFFKSTCDTGDPPPPRQGPHQSPPGYTLRPAPSPTQSLFSIQPQSLSSSRRDVFHSPSQTSCSSFTTFFQFFTQVFFCVWNPLEVKSYHFTFWRQRTVSDSVCLKRMSPQAGQHFN